MNICVQLAALKRRDSRRTLPYPRGSSPGPEKTLYTAVPHTAQALCLPDRRNVATANAETHPPGGTPRRTYCRTLGHLYGTCRSGDAQESTQTLRLTAPQGGSG